jgi:hypothetical protein
MGLPGASYLNDVFSDCIDDENDAAFFLIIAPESEDRPLIMLGLKRLESEENIFPDLVI